MSMSLDWKEINNYLKPESKPFSDVTRELTLEKTGAHVSETDKYISLDGVWEMEQSSLGKSCEFNDTIDAVVPGSVHTALIAAGRLLNDKGEPVTDPYEGENDKFARAASVKDYTFRKKFTLSKSDSESALRLEFGGVCEHCMVWINGKRLGMHRGMFGGPVFDITGKVREGENEIIVLLYGAPDRARKPGEMPTFFGGGNPWLNLGWIDTATFNCTYGWHYADIPGLGIWRSVRIVRVPEAEFDSPFIATVSTDGSMKLSCPVISDFAESVTVRGEIVPYNFEGGSYSFAFNAKPGEDVTYTFRIPDPHLWTLNGLGDQNLYTLRLNCVVGNEVTDFYTARFGIRTIEMLPVSDSDGNIVADPGKYNWTFCLNGEPVFIKGTGWCTMDALMRFTKERYDQFLSAAKLQNVNMVRAWGGGLVETDEFYDLCDEYGIAVFQEWPTAWDSYVYQPKNVLLETVELNVKRLRNRASLLLWCGGNEGKASLEDDDPAFDPTVLNLMGKRTLELDDTRPWHRQEPYGGSLHNYDASWGGQNPQVNLRLTSTFFGEFGVDCWPNVESIKKFLPGDELAFYESSAGDGFGISPDSVLAHHTPMFNKAGDLNREQQHVGLFTDGKSLEKCVTGSQLAQVVGVRHTLELARCRFPVCTGSIMYKLNDPYPAASWSTVDWYGSQKLGSFFVSDAFAPVCSVVLFDSLSLYGKDVSLPVYFLNDNGSEASEITVSVYNGNLDEIRSVGFDVRGIKDKVTEIGHVTLSKEQTATAPLFIVATVKSTDGVKISRNWYFANYEEKTGCLFGLPECRLELCHGDGFVEIENVSEKPAVCVNLDCPEYSDVLRPDDGCMWIDPGETVRVRTNLSEKVQSLSAFNLGNC
ncbi:MAG: beta-mannosidase [Clostridia bacterium]|nr:beta-mannosidase [Clostridia bacterium]